VVARGGEGGEARLVAYFTPAAGEDAEPATAGALRRYLAGRLPDYMVPSVFVAVERMPLTPNGKTDRAALPDPGRARPASDEDYAPPRNELESTISEVWQQVLEVERVGIRDNFFELGGTSVRLAAVHRALSGRLDRRVTIVDLFRYPTIGSLSEVLQREEGGAAGPGVQERVQDRADRQRQAQAARQRQRR
ncbi:MAG TPA: phosphopantetheine-binding protein, partial [Longimicrobiaceae bacterium]|nr:phosphopantetheine-binding protein [Longimicrobiaceae bacterium]